MPWQNSYITISYVFQFLPFVLNSDSAKYMPAKNNVYYQDTGAEYFTTNLRAQFRFCNHEKLHRFDQDVPELPIGNYHYIMFVNDDYSYIYNAIAFGVDYAAGVYVFNRLSGLEWKKIL